jgi:hypothetical protein
MITGIGGGRGAVASAAIGGPSSSTRMSFAVRPEIAAATQDEDERPCSISPPLFPPSAAVLLLLLLLMMMIMGMLEMWYIVLSRRDV